MKMGDDVQKRLQGEGKEDKDRGDEVIDRINNMRWIIQQERGNRMRILGRIGGKGRMHQQMSRKKQSKEEAGRT